jgi:hypothetical protein
MFLEDRGEFIDKKGQGELEKRDAISPFNLPDMQILEIFVKGSDGPHQTIPFIVQGLPL